MEISERIKLLRIQKGITQEELGNKIGVKKAAINKYENGIVKNFKRATIQNLSKALDVSPAYLLGYEEKEPITEDDELFQENIKLFMSLPDEKQKQALDFLRFLKGE